MKFITNAYANAKLGCLGSMVDSKSIELRSGGKVQLSFEIF